MPRRARFEPPIYTFRVRILGGPYEPPDETDIWRDIEIAANQTLADLGEAIPLTFDFDDPHLWSFFLSGKPWDQATEYTVHDEPDPFGERGGHPADDVLIRDVPYPGKSGQKEFLYLFDYGDEWHFGVKLRRVSEQAEPGVSYPRVVASQGEAPPQYPSLDDDWDEDDEEADEADEPGVGRR